MDELIATASLDDVLTQIVGAQDADREEYLKTLCLYNADSDVDAICEKLFTQGEIQSIHTMVSYLVSIDTVYGYEKIFLFINDLNEVIRTEACLGTQQMSINTRINMLIASLDVPFEDVVLFSVKELGVIGQSVVTGPLLRVLDESDNPDIKLQVVKSLGRLKDPRSISHLEPLVDHGDERIRQASLEALGKFATVLHSRFLKKCLLSADPGHRELGYSTILRSQVRRWERTLAKVFRKEINHTLQVRVLSSIRTIHIKYLFNVIFHLAVTGERPEVRLLARSVLKRVRSPQLYGWLFEKYSKGKDVYQELALRLLSEYVYQEKTQDFFIRLCRKTINKRFVLISIDALGRCKSKKVKNFLVGIIKDKNEYSLVAAISLCKHLDDSSWHIIEFLLLMSHEQVPCVIQAVLNYLCRLHPSYVLPKEIDDIVFRCLRSNNDSLRCLAIRCFARVKAEERLREILMIITEESPEAVRLVALKEIRSLVSGNPRFLTHVLTICYYTKDLFYVVEYLFKTIVVHNEDDFLYIIKHLVELVVDEKKKTQRVRPVGDEMIISLIAQQIEKCKSWYLGILRSHRWEDDERRILLKALNKTNLFSFGGININYMALQYIGASVQTKIEFLKFFRGMHLSKTRIEQVVMESLVREKDEDVVEMTLDVINSWINDAAQAPAAI